MNLPCEQLRADLSLEIAPDEVLSQSKMFEAVSDALGADRCELIRFQKTHPVLQYRRPDGSYELLLVLAVSFMGGQHSPFKHRAQLKPWYKDICDAYIKIPNYNVRIIGVYHYQGNIVFIEFEKDTYLTRKMHNSAAWVYTNDLYQAMKTGVFTRVDKNKNRIHAVKYTKFQEYIAGTTKSSDQHLFDQFYKFNRQSSLFGGWIPITDALREMQGANWPDWRQTEWFGSYVEYQFSLYTKFNPVEHLLRYTGKENKGKVGPDLFDFDIWFPQDQFYGDLKASDITKWQTPGNASEAFLDCINRYDRFWYVIYEAECEKTKQAAALRKLFMESIGEKPKTSHSANSDRHRLYKERVHFQKMRIIELNRINYRDALTIFNQGRQQDGTPRKQKFNINKRNIDNHIVFSDAP